MLRPVSDFSVNANCQVIPSLGIRNVLLIYVSLTHLCYIEVHNQYWMIIGMLMLLCHKLIALPDAGHRRQLDICYLNSFNPLDFMLCWVEFHDISYCEWGKVYAKIYNVKTLLLFSIPILH